MKTLIIIYLVVLFAPFASAEVYRWEDENGMNFTDDPASVPEKYREKVTSEALRQIENPAPQVKAEAMRRKMPVVTPKNQFAAYQNEFERKRLATAEARQNKTRAAVAKQADDDFPSLATAVVACLLLTLFLAIAWILTILDIGNSKFKTPFIKAEWMVVVIFMPGIGMLFYYILGLGQKSS